MKNTNFLNSCYNMAALSTCVLSKEENSLWMFESEAQVSITEELSALVKYYPICSDDMSLSDWEVHVFSIDFFRGTEWLDGFSFESRINQKCFGSLANPNLSAETKLDILNGLKPGLRGKIESLFLRSTLTSEEVDAIVSKSQELTEAALTLSQGKKSRK